MGDRESESATQQALECGSWPVRSSAATLVNLVFVVLILAHFGFSQALFDVRNPKNQKWPQAEAGRIYVSTARAVAAEFKLPQPVYPQFTLILGTSENSVDINARELRLKKWDTYLYAEGVLHLSCDQVISPEAKLRLARRAVAEVKATVNMAQERHASISGLASYPSPWPPSPIHGWTASYPRH